MSSISESLCGESESWPISLKIAVVTSSKLPSTGMYSNYLLYTVQQALRVKWRVFGVFCVFWLVFCELQVVAG